MNSTPHYSTILSHKNWILEIVSNGQGITSICRVERQHNNPTEEDLICKQAKTELTEYFNGDRTEFRVPLDFSIGTDFQKKVWRALQGIPYGKTISYGSLAKELGDIKAVRAVGTANGKNPILVIVPCHRVIGADGSLTGFSAGMDMKKGLLELEQGKTYGVQSSLFGTVN